MALIVHSRGLGVISAALGLWWRFCGLGESPDLLARRRFDGATQLGKGDLKVAGFSRTDKLCEFSDVDPPWG
jgi:hypothetical protein